MPPGTRFSPSAVHGAAPFRRKSDPGAVLTRGPAAHQSEADAAQSEREGEDFRNALDRKRNLAIAPDRHDAIGADDRQAKILRVDIGEFRNVGRDGAAVLPLLHLLGDFFDDGGELRRGEAHWSLGPAVGDRASAAAVIIIENEGSSLIDESLQIPFP